MILITPFTTSTLGNFFSLAGLVIVGIPLITFSFYTISYMIIEAFENNKTEFWRGYLIFLVYTLPLLIIGNLSNLIGIANVVSLISFIVLIYYLVILIRNFKSYFNTTYPRVFTTLFLEFLFLIIMLVLQYLLLILGQSI